jgi:ABC-type sulfate/molybdate transport systems ATPase subunit
MKALMALGGLMGFLIGVGFGLAQQSEWPAVLWRAAVAAYVAGLLMRWWGRVWLQGLQHAQQQRLAAARAEAESKPSPAKL